jgi:hypothetical protein
MDGGNRFYCRVDIDRSLFHTQILVQVFLPGGGYCRTDIGFKTAIYEI